MVLEIKYKFKKMVFESFDTMVEATFRIEDFLREQGILKKNGKQQQQWSE